MLTKGMQIRLNIPLTKVYIKYLDEVFFTSSANCLKVLVKENKVHTVRDINDWEYNTDCVPLKGGKSIAIKGLHGTWTEKLFIPAVIFETKEK